MSDFDFDTESQGDGTPEQKWYTYTSPVGEAIFPHFNEARPYRDEHGNAKENTEAFDGMLRVGGADCQAFLNLVETFVSEAGQAHNVRKPSYEPIAEAKDKDKNPLEGYLDFKFKVPEKHVRKKDGTVWYRKPIFYDHNGDVYPEDKEPQIGMGSILRINYQVNRFKKGVNCGAQLQPTEIQVLKLVEPQTGGGKKKGFGAAEPKDFGSAGSSVPPGGDDADASGPRRKGDF